MNLFTFSFNMHGVKDFLKKRRAGVFAVGLFILSQLFCIRMAAVTQTGSKQVTYYKRSWCRKIQNPRDASGRKKVFFMGSSQTMAALIPEVFDKENSYSTYSYNMALPATRLGPSYFMLNDYLKNNTAPDYIIIRLEPGGFKDELFSDYSLLGSGVIEAVRYAVLTGDSLVFLNYLIPSRLFWPEVKQYVIGKLLRILPQRFDDFYRGIYQKRCANIHYSYDWEFNYDMIYHRPEFYKRKNLDFVRENRGYYFLTELAARGRSMPADYVVRRPPREDLVWDERDCPFLEKFFKLTARHNIKVILIGGYYMKQKGKDDNKRVREIPGTWLSIQKRFPHVYFSHPCLEYPLYEPSFFSDPRHLNEAGARLYTKKIASEFKGIISPE